MRKEPAATSCEQHCGVTGVKPYITGVKPYICTIGLTIARGSEAGCARVVGTKTGNKMVWPG